jgi:hypothetical protein
MDPAIHQRIVHPDGFQWFVDTQTPILSEATRALVFFNLAEESLGSRSFTR